jgi:hypothetical protein
MARRFVVHPFLIAAFPVVSLYAHNVYETRPEELWAPVGLAVAATLLVWVVLRLVLRDAHRAGLVASLAVVLFYTAPHAAPVVSNVLSYWSKLWVYYRYWLPTAPVVAAEVAAFGALAYLAVARLKDPRRWTGLLNAFAVAVVAMPATSALSALAHEPPPRPNTVPAFDTSAWQARARPDVYYIILDGFARADVLKDVYGYDAAPFLDGLRKRGFLVADRSTSNYGQTRLSLTSSLNAAYLDGRGLEYTGDEGPLRTLMADNAVTRTFRRLGYRAVTLASGYDLTEQTGEDEFLSPFPHLTEFQRLLLRLTPLPAFLPTPAERDPYTMSRERVLFALEALPGLAARRGPKFVFAHVVSPHPPFIFGENGEDVADRTTGFAMHDGASAPGVTRETYLRGYRRQVAFLTRRVEATVDAILKNSAEPPVIILQADHGPGLGLDHGTPQNTDARERMSIFNAYYLPAGARADAAAAGLHESITPVNAFRAVFNACFAAGLPLLEERSYLSSWDEPFKFLDVTDRVRPRDGRGYGGRYLSRTGSARPPQRPGL